MENTNGVNKKKMRKLLYIYIAVILVLVFSSRTIYNFSLPRVTVVMSQSGWITKELEVRGVVEFSETFDIFAPSGGWIDEMFVRRGDSIDAGITIAKYTPTSAIDEQTLAGLLANIERTEHQLTRLNLQRGDIQNNLRTLDSPDELLQLQWNIDDALLNIENRQAELLTKTDAERDWNRHMTELGQAQTALHEMEARGSNFDDFTYRQAIQEASIILERRTIDLLNAESNLADARRTLAEPFDARDAQNAVNAARTTQQRSQIAYETAHQQLNMAWQRFHALGTDANGMETADAHAAINDAQNHLTLARLNLDESNALLAQASDSLQIEQNAFNTQDRAQRNQAIEDAEALLTQAEHAAADAARAYENAVTALDRAELAATAKWQDEIIEAQNRVDNALLALDESAWAVSQNHNQAESSLADAYQALERAEANLALAQRELSDQMDESRHALEIELRNINLDIERTLIDLRADQSLLAMMSDSGTANITANRQGIVVAMNKTAGAFVSQGERIATIGVNNHRFIVEFSTPIADAGFVAVGSEANIYKSGSNHGIQAFVYDITLAGDMLNIQMVSETDQFNGGEFVSIRFSKQTGLHQMVVPNEAIFVGAMGQHYVWTVQSRQGTLGTEYISVRRNVRIIDSDDFNTAIDMSFIMDVPVITSYNRTLSVNGRVSRME